MQVLLGEWVPFSGNTLYALAQRLGANEFPNTHPHLATDMKSNALFFDEGSLERAKGTHDMYDGTRTRACLVDCDNGHSINLQAQRTARDGGEIPGIHRVEDFGMHISAERGIVCGVQMEAIMQRDWDDLSFEMLARVSMCVCVCLHACIMICEYVF